jgi:hypothetical protein
MPNQFFITPKQTSKQTKSPVIYRMSSMRYHFTANRETVIEKRIKEEERERREIICYFLFACFALIDSDKQNRSDRW